MATATYPAMAGATDVHARTDGAGRVTIECATHDLGTGMYTIIAQVAADTLGIPLDAVTVKIGRSAFPKAPVAGGSQSTASVMPPLVDACEALKRLAGGMLPVRRPVSKPRASGSGEVDETRHSFHSFGAQFCEVRYDEDLARVRIARFAGVFDCGRILNPKTARSQMMGGIIMGLGMALLEDTVRDPRTGAIVTNNLADYRVPVNADVPPIEIGFVDHPDLTFNALGVRGGRRDRDHRRGPPRSRTRSTTPAAGACAISRSSPNGSCSAPGLASRPNGQLVRPVPLRT